MHCSRVFRSSVPSDLLPSSPGGAHQALVRMDAAALDQREWGVGPGGRCHIEGAVRQRFARRHIREDTLPGPVRSQGEGRRCVIRNWSHVLSAPRHAWNRHGTMARAARTRGRARAAGSELRRLLAQRALGEPRVVIGIDTDEAEISLHGRLACRQPRTSLRRARNVAT